LQLTGGYLRYRMHNDSGRVGSEGVVTKSYKYFMVFIAYMI